ncbi:MAG: hypothetical protein KIT83_08735 [Bryobacterales bacterium]|nr:hypothetical protein [Bryobacterales bacterium]
MKRALAIFTLLFALAALPVFADQTVLTATIPFEFVVKGQVYAPGAYELIRTNITNAWLLRTGERQHCTAFIVVVEDYPKNAQPKLVFHRYGKDAFLAQIWSPSLGVSLPPSRQEAAIRASVGRPVVVALLLKR